MADKLEAILLRLGLDASGFTRGTREARKELGLMGQATNSLKGELASLAAQAAAGVGMAMLAREALQFAEAVTKVHEQTGLSIESIQFLRLAADLTGTSIDSLAGLVNKMQRQLVEASKDPGLTQQFQMLGLSVAELRKMQPEQQLQAIASAIAKIEDPAEQAAAAVLAFGKSGAEALPELKALANQQNELQAAFERTGGAVSGETIAAVEGLGDSFAELKTAIVSMATELLGAAAPALRSFLETATEVIGGLRLLDKEGTNVGVNLTGQIEKAQEALKGLERTAYASLGGVSQSTLDAIEAQKKLIADLQRQEQEYYGLGEAGAAKAKADRIRQNEELQKALSDGTLAEVQVRVQHERDGHFQAELAELQHQERKAGIIAGANATILEQDLAFRQQMADQARVGSIAEQDVLHGGLTKLEQFQADSWDNQVATVAGGLAQMTAGIAQHSKAAFEVNKAASMVNTIVQTIQAVTKAWADYGWPYGAVLGAAIAAAGAAQLNAIRSTSFNGGGGGIAPSNATQPAQPVAQAGNQAQGAGGVLRVEGLSPDSVLSGASAQALAQKLLEYQKDGGTVVFTP
jgi:hypothetical protein